MKETANFIIVYICSGSPNDQFQDAIIRLKVILNSALALGDHGKGNADADVLEMCYVVYLLIRIGRRVGRQIVP